MRPVGWNMLRLARGRHRLHISQQAYRLSGTWRRCAPEFRELPSGEFTSDHQSFRLDAPQFADGIATLEVNSEFDIPTGALITEPSFVLQFQPEGVASVAGMISPHNPRQVLYPDAFHVATVPFADYVIGAWWARTVRAEKLARIYAVPQGAGDTVELSWLISHEDAGAFPGGERWNGQPVEVSDALTLARMLSAEEASSVRGAGIRQPMAWYRDSDGAEHRTPISFRLEYVAAGAVRLTKLVPTSLIETALAANPGNGCLWVDTTTVARPDPHAETSSRDGYCTRGPTTQTWAQMRDGTTSITTNDNTDPLIASLRTLAAAWKQHDCILLSFAGLEAIAGQTVTSASLSISKSSTTNTLASGLRDLLLVAHTSASATAVQMADYDITNWGTEEFARWDWDDLVAAASGYVTESLTAAGLAAIEAAAAGSGRLDLGLGFEAIISDTEPTLSGNEDNAIAQFNSSEISGTDYDPTLTIESEVPATGNGPARRNAATNNAAALLTGGII